MLTESPGNATHCAKIRGTIIIWRSADSAEHCLYRIYHFRQRCREVQTPRTHIPLHQFFKSRLINGNHASTQSLYLLTVNVYASNIGTDLREASARNQTHISRSNNRYIHNQSIIFTGEITQKSADMPAFSRK